MWRYLSASYFALTCYTTIGFGEFAPQTWGGKAYVVLCTTLGMVLVFAFFAAFGEKLLYTMLQNRLAKAHMVPLLLVSVVSYVMLVGAFYYHYELIQGDPNVGTCMYWAFEAMSTLGLGDFVPKSSYFGITSFYVTATFGIMLLSVVVQYVQTHSLPTFTLDEGREVTKAVRRRMSSIRSISLRSLAEPTSRDHGPTRRPTV